jgi:hypothetical protein
MIIGIDADRAQLLGLDPQEVEVQVARGFSDLMQIHGNIVRIYRWLDDTLELVVDAGQAIAHYFIRNGLLLEDNFPHGRRNQIKICDDNQHHCTRNCGCGCAVDRGFLSSNNNEDNVEHWPCNN